MRSDVPKSGAQAKAKKPDHTTSGEHQGLPVLAFTTDAAFHDWISAQPPDAAGAWLKFSKRDAPTPTITKAQAIAVALCHGWIDGKLHPCDDCYWLTRFTPRRPGSRWSEVNRELASNLIQQGRMRPGGFKEIEAAKADGRWQGAYAPASTATIPPDFQAALDRNPKAAAFFATLKGANRYALIYRIGAVKKPETRARKIAEFIEMLEGGRKIHG